MLLVIFLFVLTKFELITCFQNSSLPILQNSADLYPSDSPAALQQQASSKLLECFNISAKSCPPGLFCNLTTGHCECGVYPNSLIKCNGTASFLLKYHCATYSEELDLVMVGSCHRHHNVKAQSIGDTLYHQLPSHVDQLNSFMCNSSGRDGTLCGECLPDHYPLAYSLGLNCAPCSHLQWNWLRYVMAAYLPLTLFYFIILFFKLNTTSSHLFPVIYASQALSMPIVERSVVLGVSSYTKSSFFMATKVFFSLYGVWNLDFFRIFYSDLCLGIGVLPTLALDYAIAVYPLLLMIGTYFLIALHGKNIRLVSFLCKPFRIALLLLRRNWNIKTSVIDAFATFFFLSNIKFLSVSFDFLIPTRVYMLYPDHYNYTINLFYAGNVEYFGKEHLPYAILAFAVLCMFVLFPITLLALYPFAFFQKFLNLFPFRWYILHTFVDSFYGCYQDGTEPHTRDYRWFASIYFIGRVAQLALYAFTDKEFYNILVIMILVLFTTSLSTLQPFKSRVAHYNVINTMFLQLLLMFSITALAGFISVVTFPQYETFLFSMGFLVAALPAFYWIACIARWMCCSFILRNISRLKARRSGYSHLTEHTGDLSGRIENLV